MADQIKFTFEISLSVLDHLGRNLYRSFSTVLGEAISNSWDADAENVWIYVDKDKGELVIKDDGTGMSKEDFQDKFLKIGYSKRKGGQTKTDGRGRPYIGRKGIGKLALLSCAKKISILSKRKDASYVGGSIDNKGLDEAITNDLNPSDYPLGIANLTDFDPYTEGHEHGTIIVFQDVKEGIRHSLEFLRKNVALYFRFSLIDQSFSIFLNDEEVTLDDLKDLAEKTEFLWTINGFKDPYVDKHLKALKEKRDLSVDSSIKGFVTSVVKPRDLKVLATEERVSIDLFVNGRLREKGILKHIPTAQVIESYLYGQIHFDGLDDDIDRFTSSREGVVANDSLFENFLENLNDEIIRKVFALWDEWRRKHRETGDEEDTSITKKERKSAELYNTVVADYTQPKGTPNKEKVDEWIGALAKDAGFNFSSYAECFLSENLLRLYLRDQNHNLSGPVEIEINDRIDKENKLKEEANISIDLRQNNDALSYLGMYTLASQAEGGFDSKKGLHGDTAQYRPIRNALMHTARLTDQAKTKLTTVYENIRGRIQTLLSSAE